DTQLDETLTAVLHSEGMYERKEEQANREIVLGRVNKLLREFVAETARKKGFPAQVAAKFGSKIFTFGSFRQGVHGSDADIDTLCVVPERITRDDFFRDFYEMLKELPDVSELTPVADGFVPIITLRMINVPLDLAFARLAMPSIPDDLKLTDDSVLLNIDLQDIRSLNGPRVTDELLDKVSQLNMLDVFRIASRAIKLWAKRRAIYGNIYGFLGGISWSLLTVKACQLAHNEFPNISAAHLLKFFFAIFSRWRWPSPVLIKPITSGPLSTPVWNPQIYPGDALHLMPIITPAYPAQNSTFNVTRSTRDIMAEELSRAEDIMSKIVNGNASWEQLWTKDDFYYRYDHYISVVASSPDAETFRKWSGYVESRIRRLVGKLETFLRRAHPYIKPLERVANCRTVQDVENAKKGIIPESICDSDSNDNNNTDGVTKIYTICFFVGLDPELKPISAKGATRVIELTSAVRDFANLVYNNYTSFNQDTMGLHISTLRQ
ncbi:Poly(A) polymerase, partial [Ramicandelaber brevisporus]